MRSGCNVAMLIAGGGVGGALMGVVGAGASSSRRNGTLTARRGIPSRKVAMSFPFMLFLRDLGSSLIRFAGVAVMESSCLSLKAELGCWTWMLRSLNLRLNIAVVVVEVAMGNLVSFSLFALFLPPYPSSFACCSLVSSFLILISASAPEDEGVVADSWPCLLSSLILLLSILIIEVDGEIGLSWLALRDLHGITATAQTL